MKKEKNVYAGTGISKSDDPYIAGKEAADMAIKKSGKAPSLGIVFCSGKKYGKDEKSIKKLAEGANDAFRKANPACKVIGCTTAGEISNYGFTTESCVSLAVTSEFMHFGVGVGKNTGKSPNKAGKDAIRNALSQIKIDKYVEPYVRYLAEKNLPVSDLVRMSPYSILMLNTGFTSDLRGNEDDIVEGISEVVGHRIPVFGGSAGDDFHLRNTFVFYGKEVFRQAVVCVIISTSLRMSTNVEHGYIPTDKSMFISKASDYEIEKLDNMPAFDRYSEMLGKSKKEIWPQTEHIRELGPVSQAFMAFARAVKFDVMNLSPIIGINCNSPLALAEYKPYVKGRFWIKTIDHISGKDTLRFTEKIPQGAALYLMKTDENRSLKSGLLSVTKSLEDIDNEGSFGLIFDCALHRWFLKHHAEKSVDLMREKMKDIPFIGFHAYGEILDGKHTLSVVSSIFGNKLIKD